MEAGDDAGTDAALDDDDDEPSDDRVHGWSDGEGASDVGGAGDDSDDEEEREQGAVVLWKFRSARRDWRKVTLS